EPPRGYDDRGGYPADRGYPAKGYPDRGYGGRDYDRGGQQGYDPRDDRGGHGRGEPPTRQYPSRDRWS
ncbi:MAG: hypothetical protein J2P26_14265, partial [Nocardiopsaceae bacterium]|nr:hypothetical protein [Nocardiopsaceae bacterium]